jgi:hypothetical protein
MVLKNKEIPPYGGTTAHNKNTKKPPKESGFF